MLDFSQGSDNGWCDVLVLQILNKNEKRLGAIWNESYGLHRLD